MSNFVQNLVLRGAGLALSSAPSLRPLPGIETHLGVTESFQEVASEEAAEHYPEAAPRFQAELNHASGLSTPQVQRSSIETSPLSPPSAMAQPEMTPPSSFGSRLLAPEGFVSTSHQGEMVFANETSFESSGISEPEALTVARRIEPGAARTSGASNSEIPSREDAERQIIVRPKVPPRVPGKVTQELGKMPPAVQTIRPAITETPISLQFPKAAAPPSQASPPAVPIHVRVGRVEVRGVPPQTPVRSIQKDQAPLGFAGYYRVRRYRS